MTRGDGCLATAFRDVDGNSDTGKLVACLKLMESLPAFITYKERSLEPLRLEPGRVAVDLGCGLGFDVWRLADRVAPGGRAIGVDASERLLTLARSAFPEGTGIEFRRGDLHDLAFDSGSIDAIRIDRTLQHVEDPQRVISEMIRVLKPGGWMVCAEPDWATFIIDAGDIPLTRRIGERWASGFKNPHAGRGLPRILRAAGMENIRVEGHALITPGLDAADMVYDIRRTARVLEGEDPALAERLARWMEDLDGMDRESVVSASVTLFLASGQKPAA